MIPTAWAKNARGEIIAPSAQSVGYLDVELSRFAGRRRRAARNARVVSHDTTAQAIL
jgi:hypothetical protein